MTRGRCWVTWLKLCDVNYSEILTRVFQDNLIVEGSWKTLVGALPAWSKFGHVRFISLGIRVTFPPDSVFFPKIFFSSEAVIVAFLPGFGFLDGLCDIIFKINYVLLLMDGRPEDFAHCFCASKAFCPNELGPLSFQSVQRFRQL